MVVGRAHVDVGLTPKVRRTAPLHEIAHMLGPDHVATPGSSCTR
jgi:hypothetical protein